MIVSIWKIEHKKDIQNLMDELNIYRENNFSTNTKNFHQRINPYNKLCDEDFDNWIFFIVKDNEKIVWFINWNIYERKNHKLNKLGYIEELYIKNEYRWKWLAKKLFDELEKEFKNKWCNHITTHTDQENKLSRKFYEKSWMKEATIEFWKEII